MIFRHNDSAGALVTLFCAVVALLMAAAQSTVSAYAKDPPDPGCEVATLVSTGGPPPKNPHTLAIRWTGYSNFELAYNGQIILLDAYFDRGNRFAPLGFKAADVKKASVLLVGHAHVDHILDAASVGTRTGAIVVGAPVTVEKLLGDHLDPKQIRTVTGRGGELLKFSKFQVEPILGRHGEPPANVTRAFNQALRSVTPPLPAGAPAGGDPDSELDGGSRGRGKGGASAANRIVTEGTIAYLITLDDGFRIMYRDSGGVITDFEKAAMERVGRVDIALAATAADILPSLTTARALEYLRTYKPEVYIAAHHDAPLNGLWRPTEPIFQALKDEKPDLITISKQYREPACFDTENNIQRKEKKSTEKH